MHVFVWRTSSVQRPLLQHIIHARVSLALLCLTRSTNVTTPRAYLQVTVQRTWQLALLDKTTRATRSETLGREATTQRYI